MATLTKGWHNTATKELYSELINRVDLYEDVQQTLNTLNGMSELDLAEAIECIARAYFGETTPNGELLEDADFSEIVERLA